MLIQLTNHCTMGCPHCMQESEENYQHMTEEIFTKALQFGEWSGTLLYNISGGEPTEHPEFGRFMDKLDNHLKSMSFPFPGMPGFTIESNGEWLRNASFIDIVKKVLVKEKLLALQVSSFKGLYRNYDFIQQHKKELETMSPKVKVVDGQILSMQDLGRASNSRDTFIRAAVDNNKYQVSCLNGCLLSKQTDSFRKLNECLFQHGQSCKPFVDWRGNVHWSESICCPSYGNVIKDDFDTIWQNLRKAVPCGKCRLYQNLLKSTDPKIVHSRHILGI